MNRRDHFDTGVKVASWATLDNPHYTSTPMGDVAHTTVRKNASMNERIQDTFSYGQCHALAMAVNKVAGHPIGAVVDDNKEPVHFFNYHKDSPETGIYAGGSVPVDAMVRMFGGSSHRTSSGSEIRDLVKKE